MVGKRFGKWIVVSEEIRRNGRRQAKILCRCECGNERWVLVDSLKRGNSTKCKTCTCKIINLKHGGQGEKLYKVWISMRFRTSNSKDPGYKYYGQRGIRVSSDWNEYKDFREWSQRNGYAGGLQIDRINCDGDYSPENCRWVTSKVNNNNRRNSRRSPLNVHHE